MSGIIVQHDCTNTNPKCWACNPDDLGRAMVEDGLEQGYTVTVGRDFVRWTP